jgi:hypothetical protein
VTHCLAVNSKEFKAGLKLSRKKFIVAEIITRFKISKGVVSRRRYHLEEPGISGHSLESHNWSRKDIGGVKSKPRVAGLLRKDPGALIVISTAPVKQLERVLPELANALPEPHLKKLADRPKRHRALLFLA